MKTPEELLADLHSAHSTGFLVNLLLFSTPIDSKTLSALLSTIRSSNNIILILDVK